MMTQIYSKMEALKMIFPALPKMSKPHISSKPNVFYTMYLSTTDEKKVEIRCFFQKGHNPVNESLQMLSIK